MVKPFIIFITGVSGSGKTTLFESLRSDPALKDIEFHDIDENGVPPVGRGPWRNFRVEELLYNATLSLEQGRSVIVCGIVKPHEVFTSRYFNPSYTTHFVLVDVPFDAVEKRIRGRVSNSKAVPFDEVFNPDAINETLLANKKLLRELRNSVPQHKNGSVIDASKLNKKQMHDRLIKMIAKVR